MSSFERLNLGDMAQFAPSATVDSILDVLVGVDDWVHLLLGLINVQQLLQVVRWMKPESRVLHRGK